MDTEDVLEYLTEVLTEAGAHVERDDPENNVLPGTMLVFVDDWQFTLAPTNVDVYP